MKKKTSTTILIIFIVVFSVLLVTSAAGLLFIALKPAPSVPIVQIENPEQGQQIAVGEMVAVNSTSYDETYNISRVELWETFGEIYRMVGFNETGVVASNYSITQGWQPRYEGAYTLTVRAYNDQDLYGQAAVEVLVSETEAEEEPDEDADFVPAPDGVNGNTLPDPNDPEGGFQPPPSQEDPSATLNADYIIEAILGSASDFVGGRFFAPPTPLMVEAVDFEVFQEYDEVYCYVTLEEEPSMMVPEDGSFDTSGDLHWNIRAHLGGANSTLVMVDDNMLDLEVECNARRDGVNNTFFLGEVQGHHPPEDWNGQLIQQTASGGDGFLISYRINPPEETMLRPYALTDIHINERKVLMWQWEGDESLIDGFHIYRNGNLVATHSSDERSHPISDWWIEPPCGEEYAYYVVAYRIKTESSPSNIKRYQGYMCEGADYLELVGKAEDICGGSGHAFDVKYFHTYAPWTTTDTYLGIRFFREGEHIDAIHSSHPVIRHGGGMANITTAYEGAVAITTDSMVVFMFDDAGQFFSKEIETIYNWSPGDVDLEIKGASMNWDTNTLKMWVQNNGCAFSKGTDISILRDDGWRGVVPVPELHGAAGQWVKTSILPQERAQWGSGAMLTVDPMDVVPESDEENNEYELGSARVKAVRFIKVDIHDDHDSDRYRNNPGEIKVWLTVRKTHDGEFIDCGRIRREYQWHEGMHELGGAVIPVEMEKDAYLSVRSWITEDDDYPVPDSDWGGWVRTYFSPDGNPYPDASPYYTHMGSWKGGGDYEQYSDMGDYTIYYRLILE